MQCRKRASAPGDLSPCGGRSSFLSWLVCDFASLPSRRLSMRNRRTFVCLTVLLCCLAASAQDAAHPNFTGIWKLDPHRSTLDGQAPDSATLYIHQNDPDFHLRRTEVHRGKSTAWSVHGRTDGKTLELKSREGTKRTHMYWQGSQLVLEWKNDDKHGESRKTVRYSLSDGGKTLVAQENENNRETKWVFAKSG